VVETIRLESGHTLTGIVGSNPSLSAILLAIYHSHFVGSEFALGGLALVDKLSVASFFGLR
jgi:hypothetical protein